MIGFLEIVEEETYANIMSCIHSVAAVIAVGVIAKQVDQLFMLGLAMLAIEVIFLELNIIIPKMAGWIELYERGLFHKLALKRGRIIKRMWKTALPLSIGSFLATAEWEVLTVFAAVLGPAEAVSLVILPEIQFTSSFAHSLLAFQSCVGDVVSPGLRMGDI